jgi:hypothetical protein
MNRIEEIASRAMDIVSCSRMVKGYVERIWDPKLYDRVFAELIIEECIKQINQVPNGYKDYRNQIEDSMRDACVEALKEHFGMTNETN